MESKVILNLGDVRIAECDDRNVKVERLEDVTCRKTKEVRQDWRFKGFATTVRSALQLIVKQELLVDRAGINSLDSVISTIAKANQRVLSALEKEGQEF